MKRLIKIFVKDVVLKGAFILSITWANSCEIPTPSKDSVKNNQEI